MTTKRIVSIVFLILGIIGGKLAYNALFGQSDVASFEDSDWFRSTCLGVRYEAPFELSPTDLELPESVKGYVKEMKNYQFESKPILFFVSLAEYLEGIELNIDGAVKGAVQNMQAQDGVTDFDYQVSNTVKDLNEGRLITGTCKIHGRDSEFVSQIYMKNKKMLQILAMNLTFEENRNIRDRILKSIRINL